MKNATWNFKTSEMNSDEKFLIKKLEDVAIISPELLCEEMDIPFEYLSELLVGVWHKMENPALVGKGLRYNYEPKKFYYEVVDTRYYEDSNGETRKAFNRGKVCGYTKINKVIGYQYYHPTIDKHFSAFAHGNKWAGHVFKEGEITKKQTLVKTPYVWIELDRESLERSFEDAWQIATNFDYPQAMRFWHSGNTSIHIGVDSRLFGFPVDNEIKVCGRGKLFYNLAHKIVGDVRWKNGLVDPYYEDRKTLAGYYKWTFDEEMPTEESEFMQARQRLENTDPSVYKMNSLLRMPNSIHEKSGNPKIELTIDDLANYRLKGRRPQKTVDIRPHLFHWTFDCYKKKKKPVKEGYEINVDANTAMRMYNDLIPDFDLNGSNRNGYVTGLYNPLYKDTNASVSVNVENGVLHDFGTGESYNPVQFLSAYKDIGTKKAKGLIKTENW